MPTTGPLQHPQHYNSSCPGLNLEANNVCKCVSCDGQGTSPGCIPATPPDPQIRNKWWVNENGCLLVFSIVMRVAQDH